MQNNDREQHRNHQFKEMRPVHMLPHRQTGPHQMMSSEENATLVSNQHSSDGEVTNNKALRGLRLNAIWDDASPSQDRFQWRSPLTLRHLSQQKRRRA